MDEIPALPIYQTQSLSTAHPQTFMRDEDTVATAFVKNDLRPLTGKAGCETQSGSNPTLPSVIQTVVELSVTEPIRRSVFQSAVQRI